MRFVRKHKEGLTILELVFCFGLLGIAALGLIAAMTRLMMAQSTSSHQTVARLIGETALQEAVLAGPGDDWGTTSGLDTIETKRARIGRTGEEVVFRYTVSAREMPPAAALGKGDSSLDDMGTIWEVRVRVWWSGRDEEGGAVEKGTRSLELTKLTYVET